MIGIPVSFEIDWRRCEVSQARTKLNRNIRRRRYGIAHRIPVCDIPWISGIRIDTMNIDKMLSQSVGYRGRRSVLHHQQIKVETDVMRPINKAAPPWCSCTNWIHICSLLHRSGSKKSASLRKTHNLCALPHGLSSVLHVFFWLSDGKQHPALWSWLSGHG